MVRASCLVSYIYGVERGQSLSFEDTAKVYKNLRLVVGFLGMNLIIHGSLALYYGILRPLPGHELSSRWDQVNDISCITTSIIAFGAGLCGIIAGLSHGTGTARACMFGWLVMALNQVARTALVLIRAHQRSEPVNSHVEGIILAETAGLVAMEMIFVFCINDFIRLCRWYKNTHGSTSSFGYEPLLTGAELEEPIVSAEPFVYA